MHRFAHNTEKFCQGPPHAAEEEELGLTVDLREERGREQALAQDMEVEGGEKEDVPPYV